MIANKTNMEIGEEAWLRLSQDDQLELFKTLMMERIELGELLAIANKHLGSIRAAVVGGLSDNNDLTAEVEKQRLVIDGQAVELDRMEALLGKRVGH